MMHYITVRFVKKILLKTVDLFKHVKIHAGKTPYICVHCDSVFCQPSALKTHENTYSRKGLYV